MSANNARPTVTCDDCGSDMVYELDGCIAIWRCSDQNCGYEEQEEGEEVDADCSQCGGEKETVMIDGLTRKECVPCWEKKIDEERRARFDDPQRALEGALKKDGGIF